MVYSIDMRRNNELLLFERKKKEVNHSYVKTGKNSGCLSMVVMMLMMLQVFVNDYGYNYIVIRV